MIRRLFQKQDGVVIVVVALMMSIIAGFLALVIDLGSVYLEKNRLQKMADAAVLAGAQDFSTNYKKAQDEMIHTIQMNEGDPDHFEFITNEGFTMLEVIATKEATFFFAKALGIEEPDIKAKARIELHPISSGERAVPIGFQPQGNILFGSLQTLIVSDPTNGNFGAIDFDGKGGGANQFYENLAFGYYSEISIGQILDLEPGKMAGKTEAAIKVRMDDEDCRGATYDNFSPDCDRVILVPIVEPYPENSHPLKQVKVLGFASFFLEGVTNNDEVIGRFIRRVQQGESTSSSEANFGTYSFKLTE